MAAPGNADGGRPMLGPGVPRELLADSGALAAARRRPMSERLELALSWNAVAAELRAGLAGATGSASGKR